MTGSAKLYLLARICIAGENLDIEMAVGKSSLTSAPQTRKLLLPRPWLTY